MERRLAILADMSPAIWLHMVVAFIALGLGGYILWRRKGDRLHRLLGRVWVATMALVALSSFFITELFNGWFSPIHALSVYALYGLVQGVHAIRSKPRTPARVEEHRRHMRSLYGGTMLIAGGFTLLPNRHLGQLTFGASYPWINYALVVIMALAGAYLVWRAERKRTAEAGHRPAA